MDLVIDKSIIDTWNKKKQPYFIAVLISLALLITALALFIVLVVSIVSDGEPNFSSFILIVIFAGLGSFVGGKARQRFKKLNHEFKETIMATLLPTVLPNSTYSHVGGHDIDEAAATKIIRKCGFFSLSDTIDGQMNNIDFKISSARAYNHITTTDDKGNQQRSTVYSLYGRWITADFHREFLDSILILEKKWEKNVKTSGGHVNEPGAVYWNTVPSIAGAGKIDKNRGLKSVEKLENKVFNSKFTVLSRNEHNAFYLLRPNVMEYLIKLETDYTGKIAFAFEKEKLHIAINDGSSNGGISIWKRVTPETIKAMFESIEVAKNIIATVGAVPELFKKS